MSARQVTSRICEGTPRRQSRRICRFNGARLGGNPLKIDMSDSLFDSSDLLSLFATPLCERQLSARRYEPINSCHSRYRSRYEPATNVPCP
jgi:hypothetical protein